MIDEIKITTLNFETKSVYGKNIKWNKAPIYPGGCQPFDLMDYFNITCLEDPIMKIRFKLLKVRNFEVAIYIQERNKALTKRTLKSSLLSYSGPNIEIEDLGEPKLIKLIISISQSIFSEQDTLKKCRNYPIEDYKSYKECDEQFVYQDMRNIYKLIPFWATDNMNEVSSQV